MTVVSSDSIDGATVHRSRVDIDRALAAMAAADAPASERARTHPESLRRGMEMIDTIDLHVDDTGRPTRIVVRSDSGAATAIDFELTATGQS